MIPVFRLPPGKKFGEMIKTGCLMPKSRSLGLVTPSRLKLGAEKVKDPNLGTMTPLPLAS
jgi:hypothetical protein